MLCNAKVPSSLVFFRAVRSVLLLCLVASAVGREQGPAETPGSLGRKRNLGSTERLILVRKSEDDFEKRGEFDNIHSSLHAPLPPLPIYCCSRSTKFNLKSWGWGGKRQAARRNGDDALFYSLWPRSLSTCLLPFSPTRLERVRTASSKRGQMSRE